MALTDQPPIEQVGNWQSSSHNKGIRDSHHPPTTPSRKDGQNLHPSWWDKGQHPFPSGCHPTLSASDSSYTSSSRRLTIGECKKNYLPWLQVCRIMPLQFLRFFHLTIGLGVFVSIYACNHNKIPSQTSYFLYRENKYSRRIQHISAYIINAHTS